MNLTQRRQDAKVFGAERLAPRGRAKFQYYCFFFASLPAFAKASARPRSSPKGGGGPPSHKLRRVSPKPLRKSDRRPNGEGGSPKGKGGKGKWHAASKISKKPGRRAKKGS